MNGQLIVISGPSGVGKGTLVDELVKKDQEYVLSISATTRGIRSNEIDGESYFFKSHEEFEDMITNDKLLEYANVHGEYYGTPKDFVLSEINKNKSVILEIDVQGGLKVKEKFPETVLVFILPPKFTDIEKRIRHRGTETDEQIQKRLNTATKEFNLLYKYDYAIVNDDLEDCLEKLEKIIEISHFRISEEKCNRYKEEVINDKPII